MLAAPEIITIIITTMMMIITETIITTVINGAASDIGHHASAGARAHRGRGLMRGAAGRRRGGGAGGDKCGVADPQGRREEARGGKKVHPGGGGGAGGADAPLRRPPPQHRGAARPVPARGRALAHHGASSQVGAPAPPPPPQLGASGSISPGSASQPEICLELSLGLRRNVHNMFSWLIRIGRLVVDRSCSLTRGCQPRHPGQPSVIVQQAAGCYLDCRARAQRLSFQHALRLFAASVTYSMSGVERAGGGRGSGAPWR